MTNSYRPEGYLFGTRENREYISSKAGLERAMSEGKILEGTVLLCDSIMRLHVDLYGMTGIIDRADAVYSLDDRSVKEIAILSRREAQKECAHFFLSDVIEGDIVEAKVTHLDSFGAFVDIGCGIVSLLSIDCISVSRISHPSDRLSVGDRIFTVIKSIDRENGRIFVTMRELLGTWEQNAAEFEVGQTVAGIVRSIEPYGIFVELAPNLAGLAELRDTTADKDIARVGEYAAVYIKSILPDKMKVKLVLIDTYHGEIPPKRIKYYVDCNEVVHINSWRYSPPLASKIIESVF